MADYHPLIARAVASLDKNTGEHRRALYERARTALVAQLRGVVPPLDESEITRERLALEEAIRKVEAESARHAREIARPAFIKRAAEAGRRDGLRREETPRDEVPANEPSPQEPQHDERQHEEEAGEQQKPREPSASAEPQSSSAGAQEPGLRSKVGSPRTGKRPQHPVSPPAAEKVPARQAGGRRTLSDEAIKGFREAAADSGPPSARDDRGSDPGPGLPPAPSLPPPRPEPRLHELGQLEPQVQSERSWTAPGYDRAQDRSSDRSSGPDFPPIDDPDAAVEPPRMSARSYGRLVRTTLLLLLLLSAVAAGYWHRDTISQAATGLVAMVRTPSAPPREAAAPSRTKIPDRIGQPTTQPSPGPAVAQRVVLYEEDPEDPQGKRFVGSVVWRTETRTASAGRPPEFAVRADIEVPDRKMTATWSLRRNTDPSLPASHTIEIMFNVPSDSPSGGVQNVPGVLMKQAEQTRGVPLAGLAVKVTPGFFLIGLSALETDMQRNLQLLKDRSWFDIPIVYNNNRRAILAMEKGTPGERAFAEAFAAWRQ
jgi:hypothetical protein